MNKMDINVNNEVLEKYSEKLLNWIELNKLIINERPIPRPNMADNKDIQGSAKPKGGSQKEWTRGRLPRWRLFFKFVKTRRNQQQALITILNFTIEFILNLTPKRNFWISIFNYFENLPLAHLF